MERLFHRGPPRVYGLLVELKKNRNFVTDAVAKGFFEIVAREYWYQ